VARISLMNEDVSVRRPDSGEAVAAALNALLVVQDQLLTGPDSRAEVQFDWAQMAVPPRLVKKANSFVDVPQTAIPISRKEGSEGPEQETLGRRIVAAWRSVLSVCSFSPAAMRLLLRPPAGVAGWA
jgi:hypothetical protein